MLSGPPLVLTKVIGKGWPGLLVYVQAQGNMNEQEVNENLWRGRCCYIDGYLCSVLFFDVFS